MEFLDRVLKLVQVIFFLFSKFCSSMFKGEYLNWIMKGMVLQGRVNVSQAILVQSSVTESSVNSELPLSCVKVSKINLYFSRLIVFSYWKELFISGLILFFLLNN